jgi:diguanylate cyclase (GGDEF)-like protein
MKFACVLLVLLSTLAPLQSRAQAQASGASVGVSQPATDLPVTPISAVLVDADGDTVPDNKGRMARIRGTVVMPTGVLRVNGVQVMVQDASGGIGVFNRDATLEVALGDEVEAVGEVAQYKGAVQLQWAKVKVLGHGPVPPPLRVSVAEADTARHLGRRVRVEGVAGEIAIDAFAVLRVNGDDGALVSVFIAPPIADRFDWKRYPRGTRVAATGVLSIYKPAWPYDGGYQVVISGPQDLEIIAPPAPAWHAWLLWALAGGTGVVLLGLLGFHLLNSRQKARERELKTLSALSAAFAAADTSEAQLARNACDILTAYGIVEAALVKVSGGQGALCQLASSAADPRLGTALESADPIPAGECAGEACTQQLAERAGRHGLSLLAVHPLVAASGTQGLFVALSSRRRRPSDMQERTLLAAVKLLAMALESSRDRQRAKQEQQELQQLIITDELTRLYNRRFLEEYLRVQVPLAQRRGGGLAFLAIDIDHFKRVNDSHGHDVGDQVLAGVATILRQAGRSSDLPVRVGGEEFLFVVAEHEIDGALAFAERVRAAIAAESFAIPANGASVSVTVSIGVALFGVHGVDAATLLRASDEAMYASKRAGRDRVTLSSALASLPQPV